MLSFGASALQDILLNFSRVQNSNHSLTRALITFAPRDAEAPEAKMRSQHIFDFLSPTHKSISVQAACLEHFTHAITFITDHITSLAPEFLVLFLQISAAFCLLDQTLVSS